MSFAVMAVLLADLMVIGFCVYYLSQAGRTLDQRWQSQRDALEAVRCGLERLVGEAEERARDFGELLGTREKHLRDLLYRLADEEERVRRASGVRSEVSSADGFGQLVAQLAATGLGPVEIARRLKADPAQVRLMVDLQSQSSTRAG